MKPTFNARNVLTAGLVAGAWVALSAWAPTGSLSPSAIAPAPAEPDRILVAQADPAAAGKPVSYTAEQADRGEEDYEDNCTECHGDDLNGGLLGGAPLKGVAFESKYGNGAPAGVLWEVLTATMPPNAPGRYSPETYADLMAYVLKRNNYKAGAELPHDVDALYELNMTK